MLLTLLLSFIQSDSMFPDEPMLVQRIFDSKKDLDKEGKNYQYARKACADDDRDIGIAYLQTELRPRQPPSFSRISTRCVMSWRRLATPPRPAYLPISCRQEPGPSQLHLPPLDRFFQCRRGDQDYAQPQEGSAAESSPLHFDNVNAVSGVGGAEVFRVIDSVLV